MHSHSAVGKDEIPTLLKEDFSLAMHEFLPVAMRDITKSAPEVGRSGWDDVGGLVDIRNAIKEVKSSYSILYFLVTNIGIAPGMC